MPPLTDDDHDGAARSDVRDRRDELPDTVRGKGRKKSVFVVVDHCASECIGLHAASRGHAWKRCSRWTGIRAVFGRYEHGIARGLLARHDRGSQYVSDYFQAELKFLGITASPAFVREPEARAMFHTHLHFLGTIRHEGLTRSASIGESALRERAEDIVLAGQRLPASLRRRRPGSARRGGPHAKAVEALERATRGRGNVRELESKVQRAVLVELWAVPDSR